MQRYKLICFLLFGVIHVDKAQCLITEVLLTDVNTQQAIPRASFVVSNGIKRTTLTKDANGYLSLPCDTKVLYVESEGYRSTSININLEVQSSNKSIWILPLFLVPLDVQTTDKPYAQQEQKFFEMTDTTQRGVPFATRAFVLIDAITKAPLTANVCLFYTKNRKKDCFEVLATKPKEVKFQEKDIIAIEVKADGYQPFNGNLIIDKLDNQKLQYEIKLSQELSVLSLLLNPTTQVVTGTLTSSAGRSNMLKKASNNRYYTYISPTETYLLKIINEQREVLFEESLFLKKGFNTRAITVKNTAISTSSPKPIQVSASEKSVINNEGFVMKKHYTLFFDQSEYRLRPESQQILDELATLLQKNTNAIARIIGYSDNVGHITQNQWLSEFRAIVTKNYLIEKGIDEKRFTWMGFGSKNAVSPNDVEENKAKNRRVEIQIY